MSLVASLDVKDDLIQITSGHTNIGIDDSHSQTINGNTINAIKYTPNGSSISESTITHQLKANKLGEYIFSSNDIIQLKFNIYITGFNVADEIFQIKYENNLIFYHSGNPNLTNEKFTINYLFKSNELASILNGTNPNLKLIFENIDNTQTEYVLLDKNFELYAIYKPEFSDTTNIPRTITNLNLNNSYDASSKTIANVNACEIKGNVSGAISGNVTFNIKDKLLNGKPVSLFFNLNIESFQDTDNLKIQIDNGSGTYVDYFEISQSANNNKLKTFFYSQTENYNSSNNFNIRFNLSGNIENSDYVYFEDMFTYIPEAINFFDASGINPSGSISLEPNLLINSNEYVGSIELFDSLPLPDNYLLCDGREITKSDNSGNYYAPLIDFLNNNTTGNSCYLPNFHEKHPLGVDSDISNYNTANINHIGNNQLTIDYFPIHNHSANTSTATMNAYNIVVNKTGIDGIVLGNVGSTTDSDSGSGNKTQHREATHNHGIIDSDKSTYSNPVTNIEITTNYNITSQTNNTYITQNSSNIDQNSVDLQLISYKLYFGIRFK